MLAVFVALMGKRGYALSAFGDLAELGLLLAAAAFMIRNAFATWSSGRYRN